MWRAVPLVAVLLSAVGCGHNIGDPCKNNVDCNPLGDRFCDTASPNGYCTQENCDINSCPGNSVCVRFFTPVADETCDTEQMTRNQGCPNSDERCVCDRTENLTCVDHSGHCASNATERRWCQARCSSNSDCRSGYECRETGTLGAEPVPTFDDLGVGKPAKFCAPSGISIR